MNRNPPVALVPSIALLLFTSTIAIFFWTFARLRPSLLLISSPSYSPIFCLARRATWVKSPSPSMRLGLTATGMGQLVRRGRVDLREPEEYGITVGGCAKEIVSREVNRLP